MLGFITGFLAIVFMVMKIFADIGHADREILVFYDFTIVALEAIAYIATGSTMFFIVALLWFFLAFLDIII